MKINDRPIKKYTAVWLMYSIFFAVSFVMIFFWYWRGSKSFVWRTDGLQQHYNSLAYFGEYLRNIGRTLIQEGRIEIPLWDFSIGYGSDILQTLHYYVIGDPLNLLAVFVSAEKTEVLYNALIIVRLYLSGAAFLLLCKRFKKMDQFAVMGALVYVFCGYALFAAVRHPYFVNPMIYLPLMLIGVERILAKEKPYLFIGMVALSTISNFYFMYMIVALAVIYTAVRFFSNCRENMWKKFFMLLGEFILYGIVGLLIGGVILIPVLGSLLEGGRMEESVNVPLFYDIKYYLMLVTRFAATKSNGYWNYMGYGLISVYAVIYMFFSKRHKELRTMFLVLSAMLLIPFVGHVMHGFSYVSNRWVFGYSLLIGMIVTFTMPEIVHLARKNTLRTLLVTACYVAACSVWLFVTKEKIKLFCLAAAVTVLVIYLLYIFIQRIRTSEQRKSEITYWVMLGLILVDLAVSGVTIYSWRGTNYTKDFIESGEVQAKLASGASSAIDTDEEAFFRHEENAYRQTSYYNADMQTGLYGTDYYFSLSNGHVFDYLSEMQTTLFKVFQYKGLDGRAMIGSLASVRYFTAKEGLEAYRPYGYEKEYKKVTTADDENYTIYENSYWLPLGYTYAGLIDAESYEAMSPLQKQQALLQGVHLGDAGSALAVVQPDFLETQQDVILEAGDGMMIEGGQIIVNEKNARLTLRFDQAKDVELYLGIEGLSYKPVNPHKEPAAGETLAGKAKRLVKSLLWQEGNLSTLTVDAGKVRKQVQIRTESYSWYFGQEDYTRYLGYYEQTPGEITITFPQIGVYSYDSFFIQTLSMDAFGQQVEALGQDVIENIVISPNKVNGNLDLEETKFLCLSIPYSKGWSAYVNGEKQELLQANTMYMGLELDAGSYDIELVYHTPGLNLGIGLSLTGMILLFVLIVFKRKK